MNILNAESVIKDVEEHQLFYCKSLYLKRFLCEIKSICYIMKDLDCETKKYTWVFLRNEDLDMALGEWSENKRTGKLLFPKGG